MYTSQEMVEVDYLAVQSDPNRHLAEGVTQYNYSEYLGMKLSGQARHVLENFLKIFLDKWDHTNADTVDYEDAVTCEASRDVWRVFYKRPSKGHRTLDVVYFSSRRHVYQVKIRTVHGHFTMPNFFLVFSGLHSFMSSLC